MMRVCAPEVRRSTADWASRASLVIVSHSAGSRFEVTKGETLSADHAAQQVDRARHAATDPGGPDAVRNVERTRLASGGAGVALLDQDTVCHGQFGGPVPGGADEQPIRPDLPGERGEKTHFRGRADRGQSGRSIRARFERRIRPHEQYSPAWVCSYAVLRQLVNSGGSTWIPHTGGPDMDTRCTPKPWTSHEHPAQPPEPCGF